MDSCSRCQTCHAAPTAEICDGLIPALQRRGLTRKAFGHKHLRDNLLEF